MVNRLGDRQTVDQEAAMRLLALGIFLDLFAGSTRPVR